jgi:hypothetical protein
MRFRALASVLWFFAIWAVANGVAVHADLVRAVALVPAVVAGLAAWASLGSAHAPVVGRRRVLGGAETRP